MTAQRGNIFKYQTEDYSIIRMNPGVNFSLKKYKLVPEAICTDCWNGYWYTYGIVNGKFCLRELYINTLGGCYPPIEGVLPDRRRWWLGHTYIEYDGYHRYSLNMEIPYTGKILVGDGLLWKYYTHGGYQRPWAWKKLTEMLFLDGKLIEVNDQSAVAAKLREMAQLDETLEEKCILLRLGCINPKSFLEGDTNVWWL